MKIGNSFNTQNANYINQNKTLAEQALSKIGATRELSGKDTSNLLIADALNSQISTLTQGVQNSNDAIGILQIADASLANITINADKLQELSVRYNSAALNSDQKNMLTVEFNDTQKAMQDIVQSTTYNGKAILNDSMSFETGSGVVSTGPMEVGGLNGLSIENQDGIQNFRQNIDTTRASIGSSMQQFAVGITNSLAAVSNLTSAASQIQEAPMDTKINDFNLAQLKLESASMAQVHQNEMLQKRVSALLM
ncbi:MAG: flagellin [Sulfurospirillum sp.]|nr:flagellin [Sulfurospirillum sp.]